MAEVDGFADAVEAVVVGLPRGTCASFGEVAAEAGRPGAARAVGNLMRGATHLPWWRVIRADGTLPCGAEQAERLAAEGVDVRGGPDRWRLGPRDAPDRGLRDPTHRT
jgi:methylated-DNA-protein-cysteine methyltransferase related protein